MCKQGGRGELAAAFHFFFPPEKESLVSHMEGCRRGRCFRSGVKPKAEATSSNLTGQIRPRRLPLE